MGPTRMARQSTSLSLSSPPSSSVELQPLSKGISHLSPLSSSRTPTSPRLLRNASFSVPSRHPHAPAVENPDDLFTKFTISEVKQVHQRLLCAVLLHVLPPTFRVDSKPREIGLMRMSSKKNYGSWSGAYSYTALCGWLELEYESVGNGTAISCRLPPP